jgi:DNA-binding IclR family transcriptional regulator
MTAPLAPLKQHDTFDAARTTARSPDMSLARSSRGSRSGPMVTPVARALSILAAFTPRDSSLGNSDLAARSGLPPSTVTRIAQSLVALGYLHHLADRRKYRLAAPVLGLGYAATAHSDLQRLARAKLQAFAEQHKVHTTLSTRDRLDMIVLESCSSPHAAISLDLHVGARVGLASSPMGWSLLAALPALERNYLLDSVQRRMQRDWPRLRRRSAEAIAQVYEKGFCTSLGEWARELGIVAVPLMIAGHAPLVLACVGSSIQMTRARVERELGPRLVGIAVVLQREGAAP